MNAIGLGKSEKLECGGEKRGVGKTADFLGTGIPVFAVLFLTTQISSAYSLEKEGKFSRAKLLSQVVSFRVCLSGACYTLKSIMTEGQGACIVGLLSTFLTGLDCLSVSKVFAWFVE